MKGIHPVTVVVTLCATLGVVVPFLLFWAIDGLRSARQAWRDRRRLRLERRLR